MIRRASRSVPVDPWLLCAVLLAAIPVVAILHPGMPPTADGQVHLIRTLEAARLLAAGVLFPRWAPDFYLGWGYPFFNFYAGGAHLLAALPALAGFGIVRSVVAVQVLAVLLYPTGAYLATRAVLPEERSSQAAGAAGLIGAGLYLYAPLRFRELFVQGNLSQLLALGILPWCAWLVARAARQGSLGWIAAGGLALAALLYAHHPTAFLAFPLLGLYGLWLALIATWRSGARALVKRGLAVAATFALGLALAAPFWLPALVEMGDVNLRAIDTGMFNARANLLPLAEVLALPVIQDRAALNPPMPNSLGAAQVALAALGLLAALYWSIGGRKVALPLASPRPDPLQAVAASGRSHSALARWSPRRAGLALLGAAVLLCLSIALVLPQAAGLWEALPLAKFIAFPWRLYGPALLFASLVGGAWIMLLPERWRTPVLVLVLVGLPLSVAPYLFPRPFPPASDPGLADIVRYETGGGVRGTASANEYLPRWVQDPDVPPVLVEDYRAGRTPDRLDPATLPAGARATLRSQQALADTYELDLPAPAALRFWRFYFPGWQAWIDAAPVPAVPAGRFGQLEVAVPAGRHELRLAFGTTLPRQVGAALALIGLAVVVGFGVPALVRSRRRLPEGRRGRTPPGSGSDRGGRDPAGRFASVGTAALVVLVVSGLKIAWVEPNTTWFRPQSAPGSPAGMQHAVHARFSNGVELLGFDLASDRVKQGGQIDVRLYWGLTGPRATDARPVLQLNAMTHEITWASQVKQNAGDKPMRAWVPGFFVVDDYRLDVPQGTPCVAAQLAVGLLAPDGRNLLPFVGGEDTVPLAYVHVVPDHALDPAGLPGHNRAYRLGPSVRLAGYQALAAPDRKTASVKLFWQADRPLPADYQVFAQLLDAGGKLLGQADGPPLQGSYPTSLWLPGQVIPDERIIALPAGADVHNLRVIVGLYDLKDGTRLTVTDMAGSRQPDDAIGIAIDFAP